MHSKVNRLLRADDARKSRFHTRRGDLLSGSEILESLPAIIRRASGRSGLPVPWLAPGAVKRIDRWLSDRGGASILEVGGGASSAWFANRAARVTTLEDDPSWAERIEELASGCSGELILRVGRLDTLVSDVSNGNDIFDLVLVDNFEGHISRVQCLRQLANSVKPDGLLVFDDSDLAAYRAADDVLDWPVERYRGVKGRPLSPTETSIFIRPLAVKSQSEPA